MPATITQIIIMGRRRTNTLLSPIQTTIPP
jgi:hypothetical protein